MDLFGGYDDTKDISKIKINEEYAKRFEHNNKREDLQRLQEKEKKGEVDSDSESSESEPELYDGDDDVKKLLGALVKVKNQDPILKQKDKDLFDSEDEESSEEEEEENEKKKDKKKSKPKYLKDVIAENLLEHGGDDEEDEDMGMRPRGKSYNQEQEEIKRKFLDVAERVFDEDEGEDLIKVKKRGKEEKDEEDEEIKKISDKYFGEDDGLDENEKFLKEFILKRKWIPGEGELKRPDDLDILSEDEEEVWDQLDHEREFNFRYQEDTGDRILGHARKIEGTVRKKTNRREEQRKRKEERIAENNSRIKEETKRLKNLKKKEILEKIEKIKAIGGLTEGEACALDVDDLEDDFDPEEHDKKMKKMFDDDYYNAVDADFVDEEDDEDGDFEKPDFDKEDELLGLPKDWDVCGTSDGFAAIREDILKSKAGSEDVEDEDEDFEDEDENGEHGDDYVDDMGDNDDNESDQEEEEKPEEGKRKRKRKISLREKVALEKDMDELHKMDYEGTIGDLKTRFKYATVPPQRFGLSAKEIFMMEDKDLNQFVPLKKIAPYTETEWKVSKKIRNQVKLKNKLIEEEALSKYGKRHKNHAPKGSRSSEPAVEEEKRVQVKEVNGDAEEEKRVVNGDVGEPSKKSKRKERMKEVKPSEERRKAYGIGNPQPQKKKKRISEVEEQ